MADAIPSPLPRFGGVRLAAFAPERLADPAPRALMRRVSVRIDPDYAAGFPARRSTKAELRLKDGRVLTRHRGTREGDPDAPLSDQALSDKLLERPTDAVGASAARALLDALWHAPTLPGRVPLATERPRHVAQG